MMKLMLIPKEFLYILITLSFIAFVSYILGVSLAYLAFCVKNVSSVELRIWKDVLTILFSGLALILGFIYFISRIKFEEKTAKNQRIRNRINFILDELKKYDRYISQILCLNCENDESLSKIRNKIQRSFELIQLYLEKNDELLGFTDIELNKIISINSFVNKNEEIMSMSRDELLMKDLTDIQYTYIDLLQDARSSCIAKMK